MRANARVAVILACVVVGGSGSVLAQGALYTLTAESSADNFGDSVTSMLGDLNGDGFADIAVGSGTNAGGGIARGSVYVYSGHTGTLLHVLRGEADDDTFGTSVAGIGDVDHDGVPDLVVGAPGSGASAPDAGRAYVYSGRDWSLLYVRDGEAENDCFGNWVASAGHVDSDAALDIIIGADCSSAGARRGGRAYVYSGSSGALLRTFTGHHEFEALGYPVAGAGDVDGDGTDDLLVGAPSNSEGGFRAGKFYLYSGRTGAELMTITGTVHGSGVISLGAAGDVNHDGFADFVVGTTQDDSAYLFYGGTGPWPRTVAPKDADWILKGSGEGFASSVMGIGDYNLDGLSDIAVGAPSLARNGQIVGGVYVFLGRRTQSKLTRFASQADALMTGETADDLFGRRIAGAGDVNGDLASDILVGAPHRLSQAGSFSHAFILPGTFLQAVDPNPGFIGPDGTLSSDLELLAQGGDNRHGAVADGVTIVLLRAAVFGSGATTFSIDGGASPEDGELRTLDGSQAGRTVTVVAEPTSSGARAFAVYKAPTKFDRGGDRASDLRKVKLNARFAPAGGPQVSTTIEFSIVRPPVVFIHGLWSGPGTWRMPLASNRKFHPVLADYAERNAAPFAANAGVLRESIDRALAELREANTAVTQVDVVGHSMGGILARIHAGQQDYKNRLNFGLGDIRRLLTVDTPHFGSPVANFISSVGNAPILGPLIRAGFHELGMDIDKGAIHDLASGSEALRSLRGTEIDGHGLVGIGGSDILADAPGRLGTVFTIINWLAPFVSPLRGLQNDVVVGRISQEGGLPARATSVFGAPDGIHLYFNTSSSSYSARLVDLLEEGPNSPDLARFPAPPPSAEMKVERVDPVKEPARPSGSATLTLEIVSPEPGVVVAPGSTVHVVAEQIDGANITDVLLASADSTIDDVAAPFEGDFVIPVGIAGQYKFFALGKTDAGDATISGSVTVIVRPTSPLLSVGSLEDHLVFPRPGQQAQLVILGRYSDGEERDVTTAAAATAYTSSNPEVVSVSVDGRVTALAPGLSTIDVANSQARTSVSVTVLPQQEDCDDGDACTVDSSDSSGACVHAPLSCDDTNPCTRDTCDRASGCSHENTIDGCDDADSCTTDDRCDGAGSCVGGPPLVCDDHDACTIDACDPATGCTHDPSPSASPVFVSTSGRQFLGGSTVGDGDVVRIDECASVASTVPVASIPNAAGIDAFELADMHTLWFSVRNSAGIHHPGGYLQARSENVYSMDLDTGTIRTVIDWRAIGIEMPNISALGVLENGRIAFSVSALRGVSHGGGYTTLRPSNIYAFDPASRRITLLLDGAALGLTGIDGISVGRESQVSFSSSTNTFVRGVQVRQQNIYTIERDERIVPRLDGEHLGLATLDDFSFSESSD